MRIEDRGATSGAAWGSSGPAETKKAERAGHSATSAAGTDAAGGTDQLQLSSLAGQIRQVFDGLAADHSRRVDEVAQQYQSGRYSVDADRLGKAMLAEALG